MSFKTVSAILRGGWLLDKAWADAHLPIVVAVLKGEGSFAGMIEDDVTKEDDERARVPQKVISAGVVYRVGYYTDLSRIPEGSIALVNISGPIMKYGGMCSYGSVEKAEMILRAENAPNIKGIILDIGSPGGQVAGTTHLADVVKGTKKPIIAMINDGIAASAAMWIASGADEIYCTKKTDMVGSIGVYTTIADYNAYLEKEGLKIHEIYAPGSEEKNLDYREALKGNYELIRQELSVIRDEFVNTISTNRAGKLKNDDWKAGKMFFPKEAAKIGLIDGLKTFDQVVKRMDVMIANKTQTSNNNKMAFEKTLNTAKAIEFAVVDGGFLLTEENLNNIEAALGLSETTAAVLIGERDAANAARDIAAGELATANDTIAARDTRITELKKQLEDGPATDAEATTREKDDQGAGAIPSYARADHPANAAADKYIKRKTVK